MLSCKLLYKADIKIIVSFLKILNNNLADNILTDRLNEMFAQGYQCIGLYFNDKIIGISGLWIITKYYVGKHIEPDNVIIHPDYQGRGYGNFLMNRIYDFGISQGCIASELNCYVNNSRGQKFWTNQGYNIIGFHYQKKMGNV